MFTFLVGNSTHFLPSPEDIDFDFTPVTVTKGRLFKGNCFVYGSFLKEGRAYRYLVQLAITPEGEKVHYNDYSLPLAEDNNWCHKAVLWNCSNEERKAGWLAFLKKTAEACIARCGDDEKWRKNYLGRVFGTAHTGYFDDILLFASSSPEE